MSIMRVDREGSPGSITPLPPPGTWALSPLVSTIRIQKKSQGYLLAAVQLSVSVPILPVKPLNFGSSKAQGQSKMYAAVDD